MGNLISTTLGQRWLTVPLTATDHEAVIREVMTPLREHPHVRDMEVLAREIWSRELKESTCIGNGIAFPHARCEAVDQLVMAAGAHPEGIAIGGIQTKIHLVFCIGAPVQMGKEYLVAVGALARLLKDEGVRKRLISSKSAEEFHHHIATAEEQS